MKVFERDEKMNFVDENNLVLGYNLWTRCCEDAGWFISDKVEHDPQPQPNVKDTNLTLAGYVFDPTYFKRLDDSENSNGYKFTNMVVFRVVNGQTEKFIHLHNTHNGYYSHGFAFGKGNEFIVDEAL